MRVVTFLGEGIPPRRARCSSKTCLQLLEINATAFADVGDRLFCSVACFLKHYPDDPDAKAASASTTPPADAHPADSGDSW